VKTPTIEPSSISISPKYARGRSRLTQNPYAIAAVSTTAVNPTSQSEKANMPTWYETCRSLNHDARCSNCSPRVKSKRITASIHTPISASETSNASEPIAY
jgi:hypothetical protein